LRRHGTGSVWTRDDLNHWYYSFRRDGKQHSINTHLPNTAENRSAAERMLKDELAKKVLGLKSDALSLKRVKYEDLRDHLIAQFKTDQVASGYTCNDGRERVVGITQLNKFFAGMTLDRMADRLVGYPAWFQSQPDVKERWDARYVKELTLQTALTPSSTKKELSETARAIANSARDATINRSLSTLRSMYSRYSKSYPKRLSKADTPYMPRIQNADRRRTGFVAPETFAAILNQVPENLRPIVEFMYYTGFRSGATKRITWKMIPSNCDEIQIPAGFVKNKEPWSIPLVGPLEPISKTLKTMSRSADQPIFTSTNLRRAWNKACGKLGLGVFDAKTQAYHGLMPHDLRRAAARNLIRAGVSRAVAMKITGHKSESVFERYNITDQTDITDALIAVGKYTGAKSE
jgi:integrase